MVYLNRYLQAPAVPITVHLIGAGGTGSMMLTHLARINSTLHAVDGRSLAVTLYDYDTVSEANMGRQMFSECDLGRYKSEVLIDRVNRFYGLNWDYNCNFYTGSGYANIIITCVDTKDSRKEITKMLETVAKQEERGQVMNSQVNYFWIDCGNALDAGNVWIASHKNKWEAVTEHPNWNDKEDPQMPSCSIADAIGKQDLFINSWMANVAGTWLWNALHKKQISWRAAFLNIERMSLQTIKV